MIKLGDKASSEKLLKHLFVDLRKSLLKYAKITDQTNQARMGYVGQHLCSMVTGHKGGKSGARGPDLKIGKHTGEIKTCMQVDQLGECKECKTKVASWERQCPNCQSKNIERKNDSKWLFKPSKDKKIKELFAEKWIYLVLFEHDDVKNIKSTITVTIFRVNPRHIGFFNAIVDWHINDYPNSNTAIDLHPRGPKFHFTRPRKIYESRITHDGKITTTIFPGENEPVTVEYPPSKWDAAKSITIDMLKQFCKKEKINCKSCRTKKDYTSTIEKWSKKQVITNAKLVEKLTTIFYSKKITQGNRKKYEKFLP